MIYLQFPEVTTQVENWQERLESLIVAFKTEQLSDLEQPVVTEGKKQYTGIDAIEQFMKKLEADVGDWRTHRCGV